MTAARILLSRAVAKCAVFVLDKLDGVTFAANAQMRRESVRLRNFLDRLQIAAAIRHCESLPGAIRPRGFNFDRARLQSLAGVPSQPESRWNAVLEYFQRDASGSGRDVARLVMVMSFAPMPVPMPVAVMMVAAAEEPCARYVHGQAEASDRDRLAEVDRDRREDAAHGFIADQQCDHREDDRAGEAGEVAELARSEGEIRIVRVLTGVSIGERREQERAGVRAHMQPVGDERDGAEQQAADDFRDHHGAAEPDDRPCLALAFFVSLAEKHMSVESRKGVALFHRGPHFR